ncbi:MAG TPA: hypothetical protein VG388_00405 [Solirubrobacteraceae bacterium]|nr:hypothetical protein [Solirubrobacteraceae bacterium]
MAVGDDAHAPVGQWRFYPEPVAGNSQFTDSGVGRCNGAPGRA